MARLNVAQEGRFGALEFIARLFESGFGFRRDIEEPFELGPIFRCGFDAMRCAHCARLACAAAMSLSCVPAKCRSAVSRALSNLTLAAWKAASASAGVAICQTDFWSSCCTVNSR